MGLELTLSSTPPVLAGASVAQEHQPAPRESAEPGLPLREALLLCAVFVAVALLSLYLSRQPSSIATFWFPNAIAMAVLATSAPRRWPLLLASIAVAIVASNLLWGDSLLLSASFLPANLAEILIAAALLRRFGMHRVEYLSAASFLKLVVAGAGMPTLVGATLGAATIHLHGFASFADVWLKWFGGASVSAVSVLPLALAVRRMRLAEAVRLLTRPTSLAMMAAVAAITLLCLARVPFPFVYLALVLMVAALRMEFVTVSALALVTSVSTAIALSQGWFVLPPMQTSWEHVFVYLALLASLVPSLVLSVTLKALRRSVQELTGREAELRRANDGLERFVRIASHDLREPLNTVEQFAGLIQTDHRERLPPEASEYLGLVQRAAVRMRSLLDDMLSYSRLERQALGAKEPVPLGEVLTEVREALAGRLHETGAELLIDPLPTVEGYRALLSLMFQNLVGNALKFVPPGRVPRVQVRYWNLHEHVEISVTDNGIGIAEPDLKKLFQPFSRLTLRKHYEGTGLGLVICRDAARAHGGEIFVRSTPGQGSEFVLRLPR